MKLVRAVLFAATCLLPGLALSRTTENFDSGWRFLKADATNAEQNQFADASWRKLNLPHDWSIEGPFAETNKTGGAGAFLPSGVGWYRKHFTLPKSYANKVVRVEFDGVMQNSDVWINGFHLGHRPNGYVSFSYELTGHLNFGGDNVLAVRCDTSEQPASRWYSGAGIYRHVRMVMTEPVHFSADGIFIFTPVISNTNAVVRVQATVTNESTTAGEIKVLAAIHGPPHSAPDGSYGVAGKSRSVSVPAGSATTVSFDVEIPWQPRRWDLAHPDLHSASVQLQSADRTLDEATIPFGIRDAHFEADTGFWLNGKNFKLYGVCLHHDGGAFGAAVPLSIWEARLKTLKSLGVNAIRTAHNPPAPELLDLCDRMGFLVMDEFFDCWTRGKNAADYHLFFRQWSHTDERDAIRRDRNHPSVIIYSVGNEILDTPQAEKAKGILANLVAVAHEADPTRPVTQALFRPNVSGDYTNGLADLLDVVGQNYREKEILAAHAQKPARKILGTENTHDRNQWLALRDHAPYAGQFLWTGIDYLGEAKHWPTVGYGSGLLNRTGAIRPLARERESWWTDAPMVSVNRRVSASDLMPTDPGYGGEEKHTQVVFADWTPHRLEPHNENVEVYSNCKEVELFLNGQSLGKKEINANASPRNWNVPFAPGTLKAEARDEKGNVVATDELKTAGAPAKIILTAETKELSPDYDSVAVIRAKITDATGIEIPRANDLISFSISGPGVVAAVDNGDNASHESFQAAQRHAFQGECVAFVKATGTGTITLTAACGEWKPATIEIRAQQAVGKQSK